MTITIRCEDEGFDFSAQATFEGQDFDGPSYTDITVNPGDPGDRCLADEHDISLI